MTNASAHADVRASARGGPIRWLVAGGLLLIAAIIIGTTIMAGNFRERALEGAERELENTVLLLSRHFDQQLEDFMGIQKDVLALIASAQIASPEAYRAQLSTPGWHDMLRLRLRAYSDVAGVNLFDANGVLINSSESWPVPDIRIADRAFFKASRQAPLTGSGSNWCKAVSSGAGRRLSRAVSQDRAASSSVSSRGRSRPRASKFSSVR